MVNDEIEQVQQPLLMEIGGRHVTLNVIVMSPPQPKRAIFLVHDLAGRADDFAPLAPHLAAAGYRVVMWDMPGRGRSAWLDPEDYTTRTYATIFLSLMKEHGLDENTVLGQGWGAMLAVLFESLLKTSVKHICLIDLPETWSFATDRQAQQWAALNLLHADHVEQFAKLVEDCIPSDVPERHILRDIAVSRARLRGGKVSLGIDHAIFEMLKSAEDTSYAPGSGLKRCRARVSLLQSEGFPLLTGSTVSAIRLAKGSSASWSTATLLWTTLGAVVSRP